MKTIGVLTAAAGLALAPAAQQQPFRGAVDVVTLEVAVFQANRPVSGLTSRDFVVTDNGVRQSVTAVSAASLPVDLTVALDTSGSMSESIDVLASQLRSAVRDLRPTDRVRLVTFDWGVREVFPLQPPGPGVPFDAMKAGGMTSLHDALSGLLMHARAPGRIDLAVLFTDAVDNTSAMTLAAAAEIARRSDVLLHVYVVRAGEDVAVDAVLGRPDYRPLEDIATTTGGRLDVVLADNRIVTGLGRALADMRASYTLRFTSAGVARAGWHALGVSIDRPGTFVVRARRGYFGE
ncbi:MAG TPA: VWA domain-containing protein [Vicinamibacterales bacterium]|nr:VWA domain-containing protein [Vicinamibacterales bacterium]